MSKMEEDKGIVYCNRVLLGNWYEASKLEEYKLNKFLEQMKKGDLMLARYRKMSENLNKPTVLTQSSGSIGFGAKVAFFAPHVPDKVEINPKREWGAALNVLKTTALANRLTQRGELGQIPSIYRGRPCAAVYDFFCYATDPPADERKGLLLGGRITSNEINYSQELEDGCTLVGLSDLAPTEKSTFVLTSADYCNREGEPLKYNQEFLLALSSSVAKKKPLYIRYDPNPIPGLCGMYPLYFSKHPVSNTRWRILPVQGPNITRFEQEGKVVNVNTDIIINHCATNINLGVNVGCWAAGFYGKVCAPLMKTCLDVYGKELPNNIWQIYVPIAG